LIDCPAEPTYDEIAARTVRADGWYPLWYPQMGGYVGKAVARVHEGCVDVWVWHDGDFPFMSETESPRRLHHCEGEQFIQFGSKLVELQNASDHGAC